MKLDNEKQRKTLLNCIESTQVSGMFGELLPLMKEISEVHQAVESAKIETDQEAGHAEKPTLKKV